ncbi:MAG: metal-sulfur cluster assembly factor [Burkholderiaceae bacterium]|nr:metal-sulfur cluster assembly factor [Sulfuritalea sp.]MCF8176640.1 metal-sulfur cluster assembly factor [Burkholderiaceae bacterium]
MTTAAPSNQPDEAAIRDILRQIIDPEVGMNIVDLGLVYRVEPTPDRLLIEMTMTSPACPLGDMIIENVRAALAPALPQDQALDVNLVWEPPWQPSMMNETAREHFGW